MQFVIAIVNNIGNSNFYIYLSNYQINCKAEVCKKKVRIINVDIIKLSLKLL